MSSTFDAIIIGGGLNGLTTAAFLGKKGLRVQVLEKNPRWGGMAGAHFLEGKINGLSLLADTSRVWPETIDALHLGRFGVTLQTTHPLHFLDPQGPGIRFAWNSKTTLDDISYYSKADAKKWPEFVAVIDRYRGVLQGLMREPPPDPLDLSLGGLFGLLKKGFELRRLGKRETLEFFRILPLCTADFLNEYFESSILKAGLASLATEGSYLGPWSPLSNFNFLVQLTSSNQSVKGGAAALVNGLVKACEAYNVALSLSTEVKQILFSNEECHGVELSNGETIFSRRVISSCDPKTTFLKLLPPYALSGKLDERIHHYRMRGATSVAMFSLRSSIETASMSPTMIMTESLDDLEKSFDPVKYGELPAKPFLEVSLNQELTGGTIRIYFTPYKLRNMDWKTGKEKLQKSVLDTLTRFQPKLRQAIDEMIIYSPQDIENLLNVTEGHLTHGEMALDQWLNRPTPETTRYSTPVSGLYLCGASCFPGGGLTLGPGTLAASHILR